VGEFPLPEKSEMPKPAISTIPIVALTSALALLPTLRAQTAPPASVDDVKIDKWNSVPLRKSAYDGLKPAPAPRRDLSGEWYAAGDPPAGGGAAPGIQATGAHEYPAVLKGNNSPPGGEPDEHNIPRQLPYTALGEATLKAHKPTGMSVRSVPAVLGNDPLDICDPPGFPRLELYEFRMIELAQMPDHMIVLSQLSRTWRTIWTDGREFPKNPEPRWNGYSVGKWVDDYTFVVETIGVDERTWLDNAGRPHSSEMKVEERFHRIDRDNMELTLTIDDPKMYTQPWQPLVKFPLRLQPRGFDIREMFCVPSDTAQYNTEIGDPSVAPEQK
jgi:hypothetical protein